MFRDTINITWTIYNSLLSFSYRTLHPGGELPYKAIRGRAEIKGILFAHRNPDFWVHFPRFLDFPGFSRIFGSFLRF